METKDLKGKKYGFTRKPKNYGEFKFVVETMLNRELTDPEFDIVLHIYSPGFSELRKGTLDSFNSQIIEAAGGRR